MTPRLRPGEILVDDAGAYVALLADHDDLGLSESRLDAATAPSPPAHVHREHAEGFLVLDGAMRFVLEDGETTVGAGTWVLVPAGIDHTFRLDGPATFLDLHVPSRGYGAFVRALSSAASEKEQSRARAVFDQQPTPVGGGGDP